MNSTFRAATLTLAVTLLPPGFAPAQTSYTENFTGGTTNNQWYFFNGACLTAGSTTTTTSPGYIPSCAALFVAGKYYASDIYYNTSNVLVYGTSVPIGASSVTANLGTNGVPEPLVGGTTGTLPDSAVTGGALRLTNTNTLMNSPYYPYFPNAIGDFQDGTILSNFSFPLSQGLQITFTTETYLAGGTQLTTGADGMSFFLQDASFTPGTGAHGGSLGYSCTDNDNPGDGLAGGYVAVGIDEYGNFLNGSIQTNPDGSGTPTYLTEPTYSPGPGPEGFDNTSSGFGWVPNRIGMRGRGNTNWAYLSSRTQNPTYYGYYPSTLTVAQQWAAVKQTCTTGFMWDFSKVKSTDLPSPTNQTANPLKSSQLINNPYTAAVPKSAALLSYNYGAIPSASVVLPSTQAIPSITAKYRGTVTPVTNANYGIPITYDLTITPAGLLSLSYSYNGGAATSILSGKDITASNGPLPASVRFGFAAATGGGTNIHEIMCFQASPQTTSQTSAGTNQQQAAQVRIGTQAYSAYYNAATWAGSVTSQDIYADASNNLFVSSTVNWDASCVLSGVAAGQTCASTNEAGPVAAEAYNAPNAGGGRNILSWSGSAGIPFQWASLTTGTGSEQALLDTGDSTPINANRLNYLRGDRSNEKTSSGSGIYRARASVLGDVIDSSPTWVGPPIAMFPTTWVDNLIGGTMPENSGQLYTAFQTQEQTRLNVVYNGANDGMLHGFRTGYFDANGNAVGSGTGATFAGTYNDGTEVLAYVPGYIVNTIQSSTSSSNYSDPQYGHHFDVDASPGTGDLYYGGAWHTWLLGGLGAGGNAVYALNITNPSLLTNSVSTATDPTFSETNASTTVIGEWSTNASGTSTLVCTGVSANSNGTTAANCGKNLGNTYGVPQIRRFHNGRWGAVFGNGLNSSTGDAGIYVMLADATNGKPVTFYYLSTGQSTGAGNGIAYVTPADLDGDHITDFVYAGDVKGNIWRFDLTSASPASWAVTPTMVFDGGSGQPITSKLIVASIPAIPNPRVLVEFGTGQQTPITNVSAATYSQQQQALFGIWDWNFSGSTGWNAKMSTQYAAMPTSTTAVAGTGALVQQTITSYSSSTDYRTVSANPICWAGTITAGCSTNTNYGWYLSLPTGYANPNDVDLPTAVQNTAVPTPAVYEQVIYNPVLVDGAFVVNTTIPPTGSLTTCSTTAAGGWTMGIDPSSGGALSTSFFNSTSTNTSVSGLGTGATGSASAINSGGKFYLLVQTPPAPANCTANCPVGGPTTLQVTPPPGTGGDRITWIERR